MMKDRTFQTVAENQVLIMRAMSELLLHQQQPRTVHAERLASKLACGADDLEEMISEGVFAPLQKAEAIK
jgi:hypothetical protein